MPKHVINPQRIFLSIAYRLGAVLWLLSQNCEAWTKQGSRTLPPKPVNETATPEASKPTKASKPRRRSRVANHRMPPVARDDISRKYDLDKQAEQYIRDHISSEAYLPLSEVDDQVVPATFIADTCLPTDVGQFRLRAYRQEGSANGNDFTGREPSVIYAADKPPFGTDGAFEEGVHVRIHDQCLTSEVFGSKRYEIWT